MLHDGIQRQQRSLDKVSAATLEVRELITRIFGGASSRLIAKSPADVLKDCGLTCTTAADHGVILRIEVENKWTEKLTV